MAEICMECWKKLSEEPEARWKYILSKELDQCEECGEWKRVIVRKRFIPIWWICELRWWKKEKREVR